MAKYKVLLNGEEQDEVFDSRDEAKEYGAYLVSCGRLGAEILYMSNPGDYPYDEDTYEDDEYEVIRVR